MSNIVNIVDFELTCNGELEGKDFFNEIVEIGLVGLDISKREIAYKDSVLIKPEKSFLTQYFTDLTGLTKEDYESAMTYKKAIVYLQNRYSVRKRIWLGYGNDDEALKKNCRVKKTIYPFCDEYINLYSLLSIRFGQFERLSLVNMLKKNNMDFIGRQHRALDDAYNTARLFMKVFWDKE